MKSNFFIFLKTLEKIKFGQISIDFQNPKIESFIATGDHPGPNVHLKILDERFFDYLLQKGDIGLGEAYIQGLYEVSSISDLIEFGLLNRESLEKAIFGNWAALLKYKFKHLFNLNTKLGSKKNILAHYDLGNTFYSTWLDETMTYSSAYFSENNSLDLSLAQVNKYQEIIKILNPKKGAHILEIGCGWGGFAEVAAMAGYLVTGITISDEQYDYAKKRIANRKLEDKVQILKIDYRDLQGQFDHVVSIEMIEAVGKEFWVGYFKKIENCLKPGGTSVIQSILINDADFKKYLRHTDFIQQYIFPGGVLPSAGVISRILKKLNFDQVKFVHFGLEYARTLKIWHETFLQKKIRN